MVGLTRKLYCVLSMEGGRPEGAGGCEWATVTPRTRGEGSSWIPALAGRDRAPTENIYFHPGQEEILMGPVF